VISINGCLFSFQLYPSPDKGDPLLRFNLLQVEQLAELVEGHRAVGNGSERLKLDGTDLIVWQQI